MSIYVRFDKTKPNVAWRDLIAMRPRDGLLECCHPLPWLAASWTFAGWAWWPMAMACSFLFFLTALRLNHEAIHGNLGFGRRGHRFVLHGLGALMLGSNNAVAFNHLQHHAHLGTSQDIEGSCGRMTALRVLAFGPVFPVRMHIEAWRRGGLALREWMAVDLVLNVMTIGLTMATGFKVLIYHVGAMAVAQCLTALFAVWITHRDCEPHDIARTQRSPLINLLTYNMFLHLEHHRFPAVPVRRLGLLAARINAADPKQAGTLKLVLPEPVFLGRKASVLQRGPLA